MEESNVLVRLKGDINLRVMSEIEFESYRPYTDSQMWIGDEPLEGKSVLVYCEQGNGDSIQFFRYLPKLKELDCKVTVHCNKDLHAILPYIDGVDSWLNKTCHDLPDHDFHVLLLDLPFLLLKRRPKIQLWWAGKSQESYMPEILKNIPSAPYINYQETEDLETEGLKIGIAWEGSPFNPYNEVRSCPVRHFQALPGSLFMLQRDLYNLGLIEGWTGTILGIEMNDYKDTMRLINSVDLVVTVDTSILHLAGALGKRTFGLLAQDHDRRWGEENTTPWYPSVNLFRKKTDWEEVFQSILKILPK